MRGLLVAGAMVLFGSAALAQPQIEEGEDVRLEVQLHGGIGGFFGDVNDVVGNAGPAYGVQALVEQTPAIAYEVGYMGHSNNIEGEGNGRLNSNKLHVGVKAGPELELPIPWRPYGFAGLGVDWVIAGSNTAGVSNALLGVVPLGLGAEFFTQSPVQIGARATYDWSPGVGGEVFQDETPDTWTAALTAKAVF